MSELVIAGRTLGSGWLFGRGSILGGAVGTGLGNANSYTVAMMRELISEVPLVVDAGLGTASDAALAMELGFDAVLLNTAIAGARSPVLMACAVEKAVG